MSVEKEDAGEEVEAALDYALVKYLSQDGGTVGNLLLAVAQACENRAASMGQQGKYAAAAKYQAIGEQIALQAKRIKI